MPALLAILDTNAVFSDRAFRGGVTGRLLALSRRGLITLAVPEVVLLEVARQHRTEILGRIDQLTQLPRKVEEAARVLELDAWEVWVSSPLVSFDSEQIWTSYQTSLRTRLDDARVEVLPIPAVDHKDLLERDLGGRAPFDSSGKGYRDALIWHSILEHLQSTDCERIVFITNDNDFGVNGLDASLRSELPPDATELEVMTSVKQLLDDPMIKQLESKLREQLENPPDPSREELEPDPAWARNASLVETAVQAAVEGIYHQWVEITTATRTGLGIADEIDDLELEDAYTDSDADFEWNPYEQLDTTLLAQASIDASATFSGTVVKSDAAVLADDDIYVEEWDHNTAQVTFERDVRLVFDLKFDVLSQSVDDIRLTSVEAR